MAGGISKESPILISVGCRSASTRPCRNSKIYTDCAPRPFHKSFANTAAPSSTPTPTSYPQPAKNPYPYAGVSGAGFPVDAASAHGGWRSGSSGVAYQGEHPYPLPTPTWDNYATGSAVATGILPAILPLIEVQGRDTIVCPGGAGHFQLT